MWETVQFFFFHMWAKWEKKSSHSVRCSSGNSKNTYLERPISFLNCGSVDFREPHREFFFFNFFELYECDVLVKSKNSIGKLLILLRDEQIKLQKFCPKPNSDFGFREFHVPIGATKFRRFYEFFYKLDFNLGTVDRKKKKKKNENLKSTFRNLFYIS
jgi:hypothetical protein